MRPSRSNSLLLPCRREIRVLSGLCVLSPQLRREERTLASVDWSPEAFLSVRVKVLEAEATLHAPLGVSSFCFSLPPEESPDAQSLWIGLQIRLPFF